MENPETYRQYAAECRRMAKTISAKDRSVLIKMAEAWESRAQEADRRETKTRDGHGPNDGLNR